MEKTELLWSQTGEKHVLLYRAVHEGAMIFVRLLDADSKKGSVPVAYQANRVGQWIAMVSVRCACCHCTALKRPKAGASASYVTEDSISACAPRENSTQQEPEEILQ